MDDWQALTNSLGGGFGIFLRPEILFVTAVAIAAKTLIAFLPAKLVSSEAADGWKRSPWLPWCDVLTDSILLAITLYLISPILLDKPHDSLWNELTTVRSILGCTLLARAVVLGCTMIPYLGTFIESSYAIELFLAGSLAFRQFFSESLSKGTVVGTQLNYLPSWWVWLIYCLVAYSSHWLLFKSLFFAQQFLNRRGESNSTQLLVYTQPGSGWVVGLLVLSMYASYSLNVLTYLRQHAANAQ